MEKNRLTTSLTIKKGIKMKISSRPQTSIRMVSKKFRLLYPLEEKLNFLIEKNDCESGKIEKLQIFFDTDMGDSKTINILKLKSGILQAEISLDWEKFSQLDFSEQQYEFVNKMRDVVNEVIRIYGLKQEEYDKSFEE